MATFNHFDSSKDHVSDNNIDTEQLHDAIIINTSIVDNENPDQNVGNESNICSNEASRRLLLNNNFEMISQHASNSHSLQEQNNVTSTNEVSSPVQNIYLSSNAINPSPMTFPSINVESCAENSTNFEENTENILVNAASAPYQTTDDGIHISVPIPPASIQPQYKLSDNYDNGVDSDGDVGLFFDAVQDEKEDDDDDIGWDVVCEEISNNNFEEINSNINLNSNNNETKTFDELMKLSNSLLREKLKKNKQSTNGNNTLLVQRLLAGETKKTPGERRVNSRQKNNSTEGDDSEDALEILNGFPTTAKWRELNACNEPVSEPNNGCRLRAPTVPEGEVPIVAKFNYNENFDREPFIELCEVFKSENGKLCKNRQGKQIVEIVNRKEGCANPQWLKNHNLNMFSPPEKWIEALLPDKRLPGDPKHIVSFSDWCTFTNTKAMLMNAGKKGGVYPEFETFSPAEVKSFIGLYLLNGLSQSPQIKLKFKSQIEDPINGSDLCKEVFVKNAEKRHKHFKTFFSCQDPLIPTPPKKSHPNHKIDNFLSHINRVSMMAWIMGSHASCDEQTLSFKGRCQFKMRITYKRAGDGFQADCICENGYTFTFYFRNVPAPKHYLRRKCSALHARVLFMFDQLCCKNIVVGLDNLYVSARFCREAMIGKNNVMVHGVCRKEGRGVPSCVLQKEVKNSEQEAIRGTTRAAVLEGDPDCPNLVAFSVYDTKPVNFLSTACTSLTWKEINKKVYDKDSGISVALRFLRTNMQDEYNYMMNHVDRADQLRGSYRIDRWVRNRKWWWAIWMWGLETLLVNSYVLYKETHRLVWKTKKSNITSHYDFRASITLAWISRTPLSGLNLTGTKRKRDSSSFSTSTCNSAGSQSAKKARAVNDAALDPTTGTLRIRLNDDYAHFPEESSFKQPCCALCRFVAQDKNTKTYSSVFQCDICKVHLCIRCFRPFHTIASVKHLKSQVLSCTRKNLDSKFEAI